MRKCLLGILMGLFVLSTTACQQKIPKELSDSYVTVKNYTGIEIEKAEVEKTTDENVDMVVNYMMSNYIESNELPEDTEITDAIVKELSNGEYETVEDYRTSLQDQIKETRKKTAKDEEETRVWEKVMDNAEVKKYPDYRLKQIKADLVELYEQYAAQYSMSYDEYMESIKLEDSDLDKAAEASLKQELVADVIADQFDLRPTDEEVEQAAADYAEEYNFTSVELLYKQISKEDIRRMVVQNNVKAWLTERCSYVESDESDDPEEESNDGSDSADSASGTDKTESQGE